MNPQSVALETSIETPPKLVYPLVVTQEAEHQWLAQFTEWPQYFMRGETREMAIANLAQHFPSMRLVDDGKVLQFERDVTPDNPWLMMVYTFRNDPFREEVEEFIRQDRLELDREIYGDEWVREREAEG